MQLFISWSGEQSRAAAVSLQRWLQEIVQAVEPWMSTDIEKGRKWIDELNDRLERSKVGILCLTRSALASPWIHYEAGALAKTKDALVCSLLLGIEPKEVTYPLAQFQQTLVDKEDVRRLLQSINKAVGRDGGRPLPDAVLDRLFDRSWPDLQNALASALAVEDAFGTSARGSPDSVPLPSELGAVDETAGLVMLDRPDSTWTLEEIVPALLAVLSPDAKPQPPQMQAMIAGDIERSSLAKLVRAGLLENADGGYRLTQAGREHFALVSGRVESFRRHLAGTTSAGSEPPRRQPRLDDREV